MDGEKKEVRICGQSSEYRECDKELRLNTNLQQKKNNTVIFK